MPLNPDAHRDRHRWLQRATDELVQDYLRHHPGDNDNIGQLTVMQLLTWATAQSAQPTEPASESHRDGVLIYTWVDDETRVPVPFTTVPADRVDVDDLPLAATTAAALEHQHIREEMEQFARAAGKSLRLVRCVEVETLSAVAADSRR